MSRPEYGTSVLFRVNLSFDGYHAGEIVEGDPDALTDYLDAGWLTRCDEDGNRIIPLPSTFGEHGWGNEDAAQIPSIIATYDERVQARIHEGDEVQLLHLNLEHRA